MKINWSQRQQVLATILLGGLAIALLWLFLLSPLNRRRRQLEREIQGMTAQLAQKDYLRGEDGLRAILNQEQRRHEQYSRELSQTLSQLSMFPSPTDRTSNAVGRIDFKFELFAVRQRLRNQSEAMNIRLPHDLGIDDAVNSSADARQLMLQLRAVEEMAGLLLGLKIQTIRSIEPLPPIRKEAEGGREPLLEEYPVRVNFQGASENLFELLQAILDPNHVFILRNLKVEVATPHQPNILDIRAVLSAPVFAEYSNIVVMAAQPRIVPSGPMGH